MRFFLVSIFAVGLATCANATPAFAYGVNTATASSLSASSYPDSPEGLQNLVQDIFNAIRSGDTAKASAYCSNLVIPDHTAWFVKVFGPDEGSRLDAKYNQLLPQEPARIRSLFEGALRDGRTNLKISILQKPVDPTIRLVHAVVEAMTEPIPLYSLEGENIRAKFPLAGMGIFVYIGDGFRYLDAEALQALSTAPPPRIRVTGNVLTPRLTYSVPPVYPDESKAAGVKGNVVLRVIVGTDGSVKDATLISGDPALGQAALDAVRQWRYQPFLLNSKPVEMDSTVTIGFGQP